MDYDPKIKTKELFTAVYKSIFDIDFGSRVEHDGKRLIAAKQCVLIAVDEILKDKMILGGDYKFDEIEKVRYWQQVKEEIEKVCG